MAATDSVEFSNVTAPYVLQVLSAF